MKNAGYLVERSHVDFDVIDVGLRRKGVGVGANGVMIETSSVGSGCVTVLWETGSVIIIHSAYVRTC